MPRHMKVQELMSTDLVTLTRDDTLADAQRCMARGRIRHLPVLEGRRLLGLVTHRDILASSFSILAEVDPTDMEMNLDAWLAGELAIERRMMLDVWVDGDTWVGRALNEAVLDRYESGRAVEVLVAIDGHDFITFLADGLIVATPTGSTAYSLSAGGPIVEPDFRTLLLTPVAAHTVFNRPMVLAPETEVTLTIEGHRPGVVALDGRPYLEVQPGQSVLCRASEVEACFLVKGDRDFHLALKEKFGLTDR